MESSIYEGAVSSNIKWLSLLQHQSRTEPKMIKRTLIIIFVGFAIYVFAGMVNLAILIITKPPPPKPDFDHILSLSGLTFKAKPKVLGWRTDAANTLDVDYTANVVFELDKDDATEAKKCLSPGYRKRFFMGWWRAFLYSKPPKIGDVVCFYHVNEGSPGQSHSFIIYDSVLAYSFVHL